MSARQRVCYLKSLKDKFMDFYTKQRDRIIANNIWKLAERNQTLFNCKTASFIYEGTLYYNGIAPRYGSRKMQDVNRVLHPDLYEEVRKLLNERTFQSRIEEAKMETLISNALINAQHVSDLNRMIKSLAGSFVIDGEIFNIGNPLPQTQIEAFKQENKEGIQCLNEIAIRDLLLRKRG